jgi:hypothetical protein
MEGDTLLSNIFVSVMEIVMALLNFIRKEESSSLSLIFYIHRTRMIRLKDMVRESLNGGRYTVCELRLIKNV